MMNMYEMVMLMIWDINACLTPRDVIEELLPGFLLGQRRMNKIHKVKGGPPSRDWGQTGAKIKKKGETTTGVIKSNV
jgi:hypothetical protein